MAEQQAQAAVLFADVSGSTKLYETAGDQVAKAAIDECVRIMRERTEAAKGRVIKTIGDEVMSLVPDRGRRRRRGDPDAVSDQRAQAGRQHQDRHPHRLQLRADRGAGRRRHLRRRGERGLAPVARRGQGADHHRARYRDADVADAQVGDAQDHRDPDQGQGGGGRGLRADVAAERGRDHDGGGALGLQAEEDQAAAGAAGQGARADRRAHRGVDGARRQPPTW